MSGRVYVGTSGFSYPEWRGFFYPDGLRARDMLPFYASRFRSVEINYTFRQHPEEKTVAGWKAATPEGFVFALKAHQRITHMLRLKEAGASVGYFLGALEALGPRLGPVLFQCPPTFLYDEARLAAFLAVLPTGGWARFAFEFRHPSWAAARQTLAEWGAAWCVSDTDEVPADASSLTAPGVRPFGYLRLRRTAYSDDALASWAGSIRRLMDDGIDVFAYFKHEGEGASPRMAGRLEEMVGGAAS